MSSEKKEIEEKEESLISEVVPGISAEEHERIRAEALEKAKTVRHTWRQKGHRIICRTCEYPHASYIGPDKIMIGEKNDGMPIFKTLTNA